MSGNWRVPSSAITVASQMWPSGPLNVTLMEAAAYSRQDWVTQRAPPKDEKQSDDGPRNPLHEKVDLSAS